MHKNYSTSHNTCVRLQTALGREDSAASFVISAMVADASDRGVGHTSIATSPLATRPRRNCKSCLKLGRRQCVNLKHLMFTLP